MYVETTALRKINQLNKRVRIIQGGTSASKTISILLYLIAYAQTDTQKTLTSIVAESIPHLKRGAIRDFKNIMQEHGYWKEDRWSASDSIYTFETGSQIEFFSTDNGDKLRGARRDRLFMNEANNNSFDAFEQLEVRTKEFIILDYNPTNEFWALTDVKGKRDDVDFVILTYKDNEALSPEIIKSIEQRRNRKGWWQVYGEGQLGEVEGKIYRDWEIIDELPHEARLERRGVDFGYTNDPTAIVDIYYYNGGYIFDEMCYQKGMSNKQIADTIKVLGETLTIADSAEPKSIDEIKNYGINIQPAVKGPGSINQGIQYIQNQKVSMTKRSVNMIREYRNYLWQTDRDGKIINVPEGGMDHCFIGNTKIKTIIGDKNIKDIIIGDLVLTLNGYCPIVLKHNNGVKRVYKYRLQFDINSDIILVCTPNHKIKTNLGWIEISKLKSGMMVILSKDLMEKSINYTQAKDISHKVETECTLSFGKKLMEQLSKVSKFIIKIKILGIIGLKTLNLLKLMNTYQNTVKKDSQTMNLPNDFRNLDKRKQKNGIKVARVETGIVSMENKHGLIESIKNLIVFNVEKNIKQDIQESPNIVIKTVKLKRLDIEGSWEDSVYDLTVKDEHQYFANNILVHNCLDAVRYAMSSFQPTVRDYALEARIWQNRTTKRAFE